MHCSKWNMWKHIRERSTYYLTSAFVLEEMCWIWLGQNMKEVLCQSPICVLKFLLTPPCSSWYFRKLHFQGSTACWSGAGFGQWETLAADGRPSSSSPSLSSAWAALLAMALTPPWLQLLPDTSSMISALIWWSWVRRTTGLMLILGSPSPIWHLGSSVTQATNFLYEIPSVWYL